MRRFGCGVAKFGPAYAEQLRRRRPGPADKWYVDEMQLKIRGRKYWLWCAVDQDGFVLDILVQERRNEQAAVAFLRRVLAATGGATKDPGRDPRSFIIMFGVEIVTSIGRAGAGLIHIALSEARRFPVIARMYHATLTRGRGIFRAALEQWYAAGLLPELRNPELAAVLLISMLTDMQRIRTAMGEPMSDAEIGEYIPYATDLFLRGCGYKAKK